MTALDRLDREIRTLDDSQSSLERASRNLSVLLQTECFAMSSEHPRSVIPSTALSLGTWWDDGGESWLRSYLTLGDGWISTDQTHLEWEWRDEGKSLARGELVWPRSSKAGASYAAHLLRIAEAGLVKEHRPPSTLPEWMLSSGREPPPVSRLDADADRLAKTHETLEKTLRKAVRPRRGSGASLAR